MTIIFSTAGKSPLEEMGSHHSQQNNPKCNTWMQSQKQHNDLCSFARQIITGFVLLTGLWLMCLFFKQDVHLVKMPIKGIIFYRVLVPAHAI